MRRHGWIAAVLGLSLAGATHAQQTSDEPAAGKEEPAAGKEQQAKPEIPTDVPALRSQLATDKQPQEAAKRLSDMEETQGVELSSLDEDEVKEVQSKLQEAGYYRGSIDGIPGGATQQAANRYYRDQAQLASRGVIVADGSLEQGVIEVEAVEPVSGEDCEEVAPQVQILQVPAPQPAQPTGQREQSRPYDWVHAPPASALER